MDYRFNFSFLHDWLRVNDVTKKDICIAVENSDFTSVNRWINGEQTMPTDSILRFCNYFRVPLDCFFLDYDAKPVLDIRQPCINDQTEPAGGYPQGKKRRGQKGVNPATTEHRTSILPYVLITPQPDGSVEIEEKVLESEEPEGDVDSAKGDEDGSPRIRVIGLDDEEDQTTKQPNDQTAKQPNDQTAILKLRLAHQTEINNLMMQFHNREEKIREECNRDLTEEKQRLFKVIEQQSNIIANFQSLIKKHGLSYDITEFNQGEGLVADGSPAPPSDEG